MLYVKKIIWCFIKAVFIILMWCLSVLKEYFNQIMVFIPAIVTAVLSLSIASINTDLFAALHTFKCLFIRLCALWSRNANKFWKWKTLIIHTNISQRFRKKLCLFITILLSSSFPLKFFVFLRLPFGLKIFLCCQKES